jgi:hypothetical protein
MELDKLAIKNSSWTWDTLRDSRQIGFQVGEESVTDFVILNMKKWGAGKLIVETFTRHQESINGSDWEWWFTGPSGQWLGMRVQAKVLNFSSEKFEHLHYSNKNGSQVDLLINDAKANGLIPLYCMYSNWDTKKYKPSWQCMTHKPTARHYGNSILSPFRVKSLQASKETRLSQIINYLQPMHCIFCCNGFGGVDLPERALNYINGTGLLEDVSGIDNAPSRAFLKSQAPHYVYQLLEGNLETDFLDLHDDRLKRVTVVREIEKTG